MVEVIRQRMTAEVEGDFCIFLIGMRVNRWWRIDQWWPVFRAMPRMIRELRSREDCGFLGAESAIGNPTLMIQYWRSFEALEAYAKNPAGQHLPAWAEFNRKAAQSGAVGVWHETYLVRSGEYESIYTNMPRFGLGKVGRLVPATGRRESARQRMRPRADEQGDSS